MKNLSDVIASLTDMPRLPSPQPLIDSHAAAVVNALFKELQAIFPAWRQAWPDDATLKAAKRSWIKAFMAQGIRRIEQVRHGVENCRRLPTPFVPGVGEFVALCQPTPEALGAPSNDAAFAEAVANAHPCMSDQRSWSHQAVYHAAAQCGFHALACMPAEVSRRLFERNYQITLRLLLEGKPLRSIPLALPMRAEGRRTPGVGQRALAELRKGRQSPTTKGAA
jgi:hypothetical protein